MVQVFSRRDRQIEELWRRRGIPRVRRMKADKLSRVVAPACQRKSPPRPRQGQLRHGTVRPFYVRSTPRSDRTRPTGETRRRQCQDGSILV